MDHWTRRQLEQAIKYGDDEYAAEIAHMLYKREDLEEAREIIREKASPMDYCEVGNVTYYDGIEISKWGVYDINS